MLIGREKEAKELCSYLESGQSEFVAVYGRRRVGKTYLVYETLEKEMLFDITGLYNRPTEEQLANFHKSLRKAGWRGDCPKDWMEAFDQLEQTVEQSSRKHKVLFFDEMPWMDTQRSGFLSALEHFWNSWAVRRKDIVLIACGSATTWMMGKLINNKGGLHNRLTHQIFVRPFTLAETEQMLKNKRIRWSRDQVAQCYMIMGGIPYYLNLLNRQLSLPQNIDELFFRQGGAMTTEFDVLFASLFEAPDTYIKIISTLSKKAKGMTREELIAEAKLSGGGNLSKILKDLENCCFIRRYSDYAHRKNTPVYQLTDPFCLFYYHFMERALYSNASNPWVEIQGKPKFNTWAGYAFEMLCLLHVPQIKTAIGIAAVATNVFSWRTEEAQVDMLIDRQDNVINFCEIKYYGTPYSISKAYHDKLELKMRLFKESTVKIAPRKSLALTFITSNGLKPTAYSVDVVSSVELKDLFLP